MSEASIFLDQIYIDNDCMALAACKIGALELYCLALSCSKKKIEMLCSDHIRGNASPKG